MTIDTGYVVFFSFVSFCLILAGYILLVSPWLTRRKLLRAFTGRGWVAVAAEQEPSWNDIMTLAVEGNQGASSVLEYDEKLGPLTVHSTTSEKRSGRAHDVYRDMGTTRYRYAGVGTKIEHVDSRRGSSFLGERNNHKYYGQELWIGEARRIPVKGPEMVFSGFAPMFGSAARKLAKKRDVDPETIPAIASPSEINPVQAVREILLESGLAADVM